MSADLKIIDFSGQASSATASLLCPHVPLCGGCKWQEIDYATQLLRKEESVRSTFASFGELIFHPILGAESPWRYRNKMEFTFSQDRAGQRFLGLMLARGRRHVLNLETCYLASSWFTETLKSVRSWWIESGLLAYHPYSNRGSLRTLTLREGTRTQERMAILTVSGDPAFALTKAQIKSFVQAVESCGPASIFLCIQQLQKGSPTQFFEMHLAGKDHICEKLQIDSSDRTHLFTFKISPRSFFQTNTLQAEQLYSRALAMATLKQDSHVYDLYCGTATLGMIFSLKAKSVTGIELSPEAVLDAKENLQLNGIPNVTVHCGDVGKTLQTLTERPDLVILDPPRCGLSDTAVAEILRLAPKEILYISCNPETQAKNCKTLVENGYRLLELQPVDQFPHTLHIENIARLEAVGLTVFP